MEKVMAGNKHVRGAIAIRTGYKISLWKSNSRKQSSQKSIQHHAIRRLSKTAQEIT